MSIYYIYYTILHPFAGFETQAGFRFSSGLLHPGPHAAGPGKRLWRARESLEPWDFMGFIWDSMRRL